MWEAQPAARALPQAKSTSQVPAMQASLRARAVAASLQLLRACVPAKSGGWGSAPCKQLPLSPKPRRHPQPLSQCRAAGLAARAREACKAQQARCRHAEKLLWQRWLPQPVVAPPKLSAEPWRCCQGLRTPRAGQPGGQAGAREHCWHAAASNWHRAGGHHQFSCFAAKSCMLRWLLGCPSRLR